MPGAVYRDPPNAGLLVQAVAPRTVTTTTTGTAQDMLQGDGRCMMQLNAAATSLTGLSVRVQQSTLTNSGMTDVTGASISVTTDGVGAVTFDRDKRYIQAVFVLNGTTAVVAVTFLENLKVF